MKRRGKPSEMAVAGGKILSTGGSKMKLFDAHCHLQDKRIYAVRKSLIRTAAEAGVHWFAVNGVSEGDWDLVKQIGEEHTSVIPCFGLHPWFVGERSSTWFENLRNYFDVTPTACVGEIGLDKGSQGKKVDFVTQVNVFRQQLELAKDLQRPVSVHCVRALGDLLQILKHVGPFPAGVILHSFTGPAEMVPELAKLGCYFSFSGFLTFLKQSKAKNVVKSIPIEKILLETDAPDGLPKLDMNSLFHVPANVCAKQELQDQTENSTTQASSSPKEVPNQPANICSILSYVADLLEIPKEELADVAYTNAIRVFSFQGSKISFECRATWKSRLIK